MVRRRLRLLCPIVATLCACILRAPPADGLEVRFGHFDMAQPFKVACSRGWFDKTLGNGDTLKVYCLPQSSGGYAVSKLDDGDLDLAILGSTPWATLVSRGIDADTVMIEYVYKDNEGLVVRKDSGIRTPLDLAGKRIACPFGSTAQYHMVLIMKLFNIEIELVDKSPSVMLEDWDNKEIDGAYIWGGVYEQMYSSKAPNEGEILLQAGVLGGWTSHLFNTFTVNRAFARTHREALTHILDVIRILTKSYHPYPDSNWNVDDPTGFYASVAHATGLYNGSTTAGRRKVIQRHEECIFLDEDTQLSCQYLASPADGSPCEKFSGTALETYLTSEFLRDFKNIHSVSPKGRFFASDAKPTDYFQQRHDGSFLRNATAAQRITINDLLESSGSLVKPPQSWFRGGDSTCSRIAVLTNASSGSFSDGAGTLDANSTASYSDEMECSWLIVAPSNTSVITVTFDAFRVWAGDYVRVYEGEDTGGTLLGQLAGLDRVWPPFSGVGRLLVTFVTDSNREEAYNLPFPDGIRVSYTASNSGCDDCSGHGECLANGLCRCDKGYGGGDCSHEHCLGTHKHAVGATSGSMSSGVKALSDGHLYPNSARCDFVVEPETAFVRFDLDYDLEETFDYLRIFSGDEEITRFTGNGRQSLTVPVGVDRTARLRFTSDNKGRRSGFNATFEGRDTVCTLDADCGHGTCKGGSCRCEAGYTGHACASTHCLLNSVVAAEAPGRSGRIMSQPARVAVPPMAECTWNVIAPKNASHVGFRFRFDSPLDLEPDSDDSLVVGPYEIKLNTCHSDSECGEPWQEGTCVNGLCSVTQVIDVPGAEDLALKLKSDRNDIGNVSHQGLNGSWYSTTSCPREGGETSCVANGGVCLASSCFLLADDTRAVDCSCDVIPGTGCLPGQFAVGENQCWNCPVGTFSDGLRVSSCQICGSGRVATQDGQSQCDDCPVGKALADAGNYHEEHDEWSDCKACSPGKYNNDTGQAECEQCPEASDSPAGQVQCTHCKPGFYYEPASNSESTKCRRCNSETRWCEGADFVAVPRKDYFCPIDIAFGKRGTNSPRSLKTDLKESRCPRKTCKGPGDEYPQDDGDDDLEGLVDECWRLGNFLEGEAWPASNATNCSSMELQCTEGAYGLLCGGCLTKEKAASTNWSPIFDGRRPLHVPKHGYTFSSSTMACIKCNDKVTGAAVLTVIAVVTMVASALSSSAVVAYCNSFKKRLFVSILAPYYDIGSIKVLWSSYQIMSSIASVVDVILPAPLHGFLSAIASVTQVDFSEAIGGACVSYLLVDYDKRAMLSSIVPFGVLLVVFIAYHTRMAMSEQDDVTTQQRIYGQHMFAYLLISYCILPEVTKLLLGGLQCSEMKTSKGRISYLRKQPTLTCTSDRYTMFEIAVWLLLAAYASVLLSYYVLLRRRRDRILLCDAASLELRHASRYDPELRPFQFLIRPYKRDFYYWDVLDMFRRIFFCSILPLIKVSSVEKAGIGCVLSIMLLMIQSNLKPYEKAVTNSLSEACQYLIFFVFFTALATENHMFTAAGDQGWSPLGVTCLASNLIVLAVSFRPGLKVLMVYRATEARLKKSIADVWKEGGHDSRLAPMRIESQVLQLGRVCIEGAGASPKFNACLEKEEYKFKVGEPAADGRKYLNVGGMLEKLRERIKQTAEAVHDHQVAAILEQQTNVAKDDLHEHGLRVSDSKAALSTKSGRSGDPAAPTEGIDQSAKQTGIGSARLEEVGEKGMLLLKKVSLYAAVLNVAIGEVLDAAPREGLVTTCDVIIEDTYVVLRPIYAAVWLLISHTEAKYIESYEIELAGLKARARGARKQHARLKGRLIHLVRDALIIRESVGLILNGIAQRSISKLNGTAAATIPLFAAMESIQMKPAVDVDDVCLLQYEFRAPDMRVVADILAEFHKSADLVVVDVEDQMVATSQPSGWRCCMIFFILQDDFAQHVCQATIVHQRFHAARYHRRKTQSISHSHRALTARVGPAASTTGSFKGIKLFPTNTTGGTVTSVTSANNFEEMDSRLEACHQDLELAHNILSWLGMEQDKRAAQVAQALGDGNEQVVADMVSLGVSEEMMMRSGAGRATINMHFRYRSPKKAKPAAGKLQRKPSRLESLHDLHARELGPINDPAKKALGRMRSLSMKSGPGFHAPSPVAEDLDRKSVV